MSDVVYPAQQDMMEGSLKRKQFIVDNVNVLLKSASNDVDIRTVRVVELRSVKWS